MRDINKLLQEIPLDELMGDIETDITTSPIICDKGSKPQGAARVKTHKAGTITAVAAAAALAIGGGLYWGINNNKIDPLSYTSKNGINTSTENQNRILIEQYIERKNGDYKLLGDNLVVYNQPIAPEDYIVISANNTEYNYDFQILGYSYSGDVVNLYYCNEDSYRHGMQVQIDSEVKEREITAEYDERIKEAEDNGDRVKSNELTSEMRSKINELYEGREYFLYPIDLDSTDCYYEITNSDGERVIGVNTDLGSGELIGDYHVDSIAIDMNKIHDNKAYFKLTYLGSQCDTLELSFDKYKQTVYDVINCDEPCAFYPDGSLKKEIEYTVKSIAYDYGFVDVTIETADDIQNTEIINGTITGVCSENGNYSKTCGFVTPVYKNGTVPVTLKKIIDEVSSSDGVNTIKLRYSALDTPIDVKNLDHFIVGNKRIYTGNSEENRKAYGVICNNMAMEDMYYFNTDIQAVEDMLEQIKSESETVDVDEYDNYLPQEYSVTIYSDTGEIKTYCGRVNLFDNDIYDDPGYTKTVYTLLIDGNYYKLSEKQQKDYRNLCENITKQCTK